jgi:integrase
MSSVVVPFPVCAVKDTDLGGLMTTEDVVIRHLKLMELRGLSAETIGARRWLLLRLRAAHGPLLDLGPAGLLAWREGLAVDRDTVRTYVSHVRQFYAWARRSGLIDGDPSADLPVPRRRKRLARPIGEQALTMAMAGAPARIRPWLALAAWAGLRAKEIALLRREHVIDTGRVPGLFVASDATKGADERFVPLHPVVTQALAEHGLPRSGWVFPRGDGLPGPNRPHTISHLSNRYLHGAGISETLHQLRHRFGTVFYAECLDPKRTKEVMGHRNLESTDGYIKIASAPTAEIIARIPGPGYFQVVNR